MRLDTSRCAGAEAIISRIDAAAGFVTKVLMQNSVTQSDIHQLIVSDHE
jgi:hypothetical protein